MSDCELIRFIQFIKNEDESIISIAKGTTIIGKQPNSNVWVLNGTTQISDAGEHVTYEQSGYMWSPMCISAHCDKVSFTELVPKMHYENSISLHEFVDSLKSISKHNYISALLVVGGAIMAFHYNKVATLFGGFPIVMALGETETGKSTAVKAGLSLYGMSKDGFYVDGSYGYFMERSALSCLHYGIDEACINSKQLDLVKLIVDLNGAAKTANLRRGAFLPRSVPLIATNSTLKDDPR